MHWRSSSLFLLHISQYCHGLCHTRHIVDLDDPVAVGIFEVAAARIVHDITDNSPEGFALVESGGLVGDKLHRHEALPQHDLLATQLSAQSPEHDDLHQFLTLMGHGAESVYESLAISLQGIVVTLSTAQSSTNSSPETSRPSLMSSA